MNSYKALMGYVMEGEVVMERVMREYDLNKSGSLLQRERM